MSDISPKEFARQRQWFHRLLGCSPRDRRDLLEQIEMTDPELCLRLTRMLKHLDADTWTTGLSLDADIDTICQPLCANTVIAGRYRIETLLATGGMGEVYQARRIDGARQSVAIKRIRSSTIRNVAEFVEERRILARLRHAHIAQLIDAGVTKCDRPWFALELVTGEHITDWCDARQLRVPARIWLFIGVCEAVQYAHDNQILHRDLKPSNILVTSDGQPKLLDFGIAKRFGDCIERNEPKTQALAFTPIYASPEQLRGEPTTPSSDVYQLGLILFELVCGLPVREIRRHHDTSPHNNDHTAFHLGRILASQTPKTLDALAAHRSTTRGALRRLLRGDLSYVISRVLAENPQQRYASVSAFSEDLQRWLAHRPVIAHGDSVGYRLRKHVRRHRLATAAAGLALVLLMAAGVRWQAEAQHGYTDERDVSIMGAQQDVFGAND